MSQTESYRVLGLMSGSSLDGLDIAYCHFIPRGDRYDFEIIHAATVPLSENILNDLRLAATDSSCISQADLTFGAFCGSAVLQFLQDNASPFPDFIGSHGHTIAHHPERGFSLQIGNAQSIRRYVPVPVISDFRNADIQAGGQGAPLVPVCDALLFKSYSVCLNVGGIANISFDINGVRYGYDVCAANQILNAIARKCNMPFDEGGKIAASGNVNQELLEAFDTDAFLMKPFPKSLDNAYVKKHFIDLLEKFDVSLPDQMATATEHIAQQIGKAIRSATGNGSELKILITGGGAYNTALINRIAALCNTQIDLPSDVIIQYKEALAIALMAVLRWRHIPNFFPSVTGARTAVCGGVITQ